MSPEEADILPVAVGEGARDSIVFRTPGGGGVLFVPASELGVGKLFLVFSDEAPARAPSSSRWIPGSSAASPSTSSTIATCRGTSSTR